MEEEVEGHLFDLFGSGLRDPKMLFLSAITLGKRQILCPARQPAFGRALTRGTQDLSFSRSDFLSAKCSDLCHLTKCLLFVRDMPLAHVKNLQTAYKLPDLVITRRSPQARFQPVWLGKR